MTEIVDSSNEEGPGAVYRIFTSMENVLDKLKVLEYEKNYCKAFHMKPISRHYFAIATNPGEQFNAFISLGAWLVRECGYEMEQPQEYDDPNASITTLLQAVRQMNDNTNISPGKLKSGCGESVIFVLEILVDYALKKRGFCWSLPRYIKELDNDGTGEEIVEEDGGLEASDDEDDIEARLGGLDDGDDDDDGVMMDLDGMSQMNFKKEEGDKESISSKPEAIIESNVTSAEWQLEVERVLPQLKVTIRNESRDWRTHRDQFHQSQADLKTSFAEMQPHIQRLHEDLTKSLEKISTREKYLNNQVDQILSNYRVAQEQLVVVRDKRKEASGGINQRSRVLSDLTDELERCKQQMEERGSNMSDGWPVTRLRQAMQRLKVEMRQMLIRSGLLEHLLLQESLRVKSGVVTANGMELRETIA